VREVAREVASESLTDLPPSVGLPEGKVPRHLGTMGLNTLPRKPPGAYDCPFSWRRISFLMDSGRDSASRPSGT
jgi:hypothetical protein